MRWLWGTLVLGWISISIACSSSNEAAGDGTACSSAGGICIFASCTAYCLNGTCFTPLEAGVQDCPDTLTNSAGITNSGNPCCVLPPETLEGGAPEDSSTDSGQTMDATLGADADADADATVSLDSSVMTDGSAEGGTADGGTDAETGTLTCLPPDDGGQDGPGMCMLDGGDLDSSALDASSDG
jgi:hypothetical protein